jgi:hypothetical protein
MVRLATDRPRLFLRSKYLVESTIMNSSPEAQFLRKRCIIGVIGGDESHQVAAARKIGEEIARADQIILTGGRPEPGNEVTA